MEIPINEKYKITSDSKNYIVNQRQVSKEDGSLTGWKQVEFYPNFESITNDILENELRASDAKTFQEVVNILKRLEKPVQQLVGSSQDKL